MSHDPVPPLLDFNTDQLIPDMPNLTFDLKDQLAGLCGEPMARLVSPVSTMSTNPLLSQPQTHNQPGLTHVQNSSSR